MRSFIIIIACLLSSLSFAQTISTPAPVSTAVSISVLTSQITVTNPTGGTLIKAANINRKSILIRNTGLVSMYVGPRGVTVGLGFLLKADETMVLDRNTAAIYGIVSAGTTTASIFEE